MDKIIINLAEDFVHLTSAPIVEAVIDIRAHATKPFEEDTVRSFLEEKLAGYNFLDSQREFSHEFKLEGPKPPEQTFKDLGWKGLRFQAADERSIAQFNRDGFIFSRLAPYQDWKSLLDNSIYLWHIFMDMAQPVGINRIGLRYINRIELPQGESIFEQYINPAPEPPKGLALPFYGYMHHDTLAVPGHPYAVNLIRTIQQPQSSGSGGIGLIIDIDVFTVQSFEYDEACIIRTLNEMRWVKNKAFFGSITDKALELFR